MAEVEADILEAGRLLFSQPCRFVALAARPDQVPDDLGPEVAFAGRSNVGKSSLINALTGHGGLAKTSNTPGRTQALVFFDLGGRLTLTDLPGYGFAVAPKSEVARWTRLVTLYLRGRPSLRRVLLLLDARHGLKDTDREVMAMLDGAAVSYQAVLTKVDKLPAPALENAVAAVAMELARHTAAHPVVLATSARTGDGLAQVRAALVEMARPQA